MLEPCQVTGSMKQDGGTTDVEVGVTALRLNVAVDVVELASSLQASVLEPLAQPDPATCPPPPLLPPPARPLACGGRWQSLKPSYSTGAHRAVSGIRS